MEAQTDCWLSDSRCISCNAGFHLEQQELWVCDNGFGYIVSYGCGSC